MGISIIPIFILENWGLKESKPVSQDHTASKYLSCHSNPILQLNFNYAFVWCAISLLYAPVPFILSSLNTPSLMFLLCLPSKPAKIFLSIITHIKQCCFSEGREIRILQKMCICNRRMMLLQRQNLERPGIWSVQHKFIELIGSVKTQMTINAHYCNISENWSLFLAPAINRKRPQMCNLGGFF